MKITVLGSGGWGTALAMVLHRNGHRVCLWSYCKEESENLDILSNLKKGQEIKVLNYETKDSETSKIISNLENKYGGVLIFHTFDRSEQGVWQKTPYYR